MFVARGPAFTMYFDHDFRELWFGKQNPLWNGPLISFPFPGVRRAMMTICHLHIRQSKIRHSPPLPVDTLQCFLVTSSNGNIFRVTGPQAGNSPVPGEFPAQRPVMRSFDVFFDLRPNKRLSKQRWGRWFETPSSPVWRHCNVMISLCQSETVSEKNTIYCKNAHADFWTTHGPESALLSKVHLPEWPLAVPLTWFWKTTNGPLSFEEGQYHLSLEPTLDNENNCNHIVLVIYLHQLLKVDWRFQYSALNLIYGIAFHLFEMEGQIPY